MKTPEELNCTFLENGNTSAGTVIVLPGASCGAEKAGFALV